MPFPPQQQPPMMPQMNGAQGQQFPQPPQQPSMGMPFPQPSGAMDPNMLQSVIPQIQQQLQYIQMMQANMMQMAPQFANGQLDQQQMQDVNIGRSMYPQHHQMNQQMQLPMMNGTARSSTTGLTGMSQFDDVNLQKSSSIISNNQFLRPQGVPQIDLNQAANEREGQLTPALRIIPSQRKKNLGAIRRQKFRDHARTKSAEVVQPFHSSNLIILDKNVSPSPDNSPNKNSKDSPFKIKEETKGEEQTNQGEMNKSGKSVVDRKEAEKNGVKYENSDNITSEEQSESASLKHDDDVGQIDEHNLLDQDVDSKPADQTQQQFNTIIEDDEYNYQPTPQFVDEKFLAVGLSGRGAFGRQRSGQSGAGIIIKELADQSAQRQKSGDSNSGLLKIPGKKQSSQVQGVKRTESEIDGELVSKISQANLLAVTNFPDEVNPSGMNLVAMKEMDEFLLEGQDEEPSGMGFDNLNIIDSEQVDKYLRMDSKKSKRSKKSKGKSRRNSRLNSKRGAATGYDENDLEDLHPLAQVVNLSESSSDSLKKKANNVKELKELESDDSLLGDTNKKVQINNLSSRRKTEKKDQPVKSQEKKNLTIQIAPQVTVTKVEPHTSIPKKENSLDQNLNDVETPLRQAKHHLPLQISAARKQQSDAFGESSPALRHDKSLSSNQFSEYMEKDEDELLDHVSKKEENQLTVKKQSSVPKLQLPEPKSNQKKETDPFNLISEEERSKGSFRNDIQKPTIMVVGSTPRTNIPVNYQINKGEVIAAVNNNAKSSGSLRELRVGGIKDTLKSDKKSDIKKLDHLQAQIQQMELQAQKLQQQIFRSETNEKKAGFLSQQDIESNQGSQMPVRQETEQTIQSLLTSQQNTNSNLKQKLNSQWIQGNKFGMTGKRSKNSHLGETYEISEDIYISQNQTDHNLSQQNRNMATLKMKTLNSQNLTQKAKELQSEMIFKQQNSKLYTNMLSEPNLIPEIRESNNSSDKKTSSKHTDIVATTEKKSKDNSGQGNNTNMTPLQQYEVNSNIKSLLANTMSIQQQLSSQEQSSSLLKNSQASKMTLISSTGIVQQTDRPFMEFDKLEESDDKQQQLKSKSYQKDDILIQLIQAHQTQKKNILKAKMTLKGNKMDESPNYGEPKMKNQETILQYRSMYTVSTHSNQPSMNSKAPSMNVNSFHQKFGKQKTHHQQDFNMQIDEDEEQKEQEDLRIEQLRQKKEQMSAIQMKFDKVFGNCFKGYNKLLTKKIGAIKQNALHLKQRGYEQESLNFEAIVEYTQYVDSNIFEAMKVGLFEQQQQKQPKQQVSQQKPTSVPIIKELKSNNVQNQQQIRQGAHSAQREIRLTPVANERELSNIVLQNNKSEEILPNNINEDIKDLQVITDAYNDHLKYIKRDNKQRRMRQALRKEEAEMLEKEELNERKMQNELRFLEIEAMRLARKQSVEQRLKIRKLSKQENQTKQQKLKITVQKKPLFMKIQEKFKNNEDKFQQDIQKKQLELRKNKYNPIRSEELNEFKEKCDQIVGILNQKKQNERDNRLDDAQKEFDINKLKSDIYENVVQQDMQKKEQIEQESKVLRDRLDKRQSYAKYIQMVYKPQIDETKQKELQKRIECLRHPVKKQIKYPPGMCLRRINSGDQRITSTGPPSQNGLNSEANPDIQNLKIELDFVSTSQNGGENLSTNDQIQKKKLVQNPSAQKLTLPPLSVNGNSQRQNYSAEKGSKTTSNQMKIKSNSSKPIGKSSSLAHLERYEENKFLKKKISGQQKPPKQIDYLKEMKQNRVNKKTAKKQSALEKLQKLEHEQTAQSKDVENINESVNSDENLRLLEGIKAKMAILDHQNSEQQSMHMS